MNLTSKGLALLAAFLLAACGGGGGGDNASSNSASSSSSSSGSGFTPESGSTTLTGNGIEGLWYAAGSNGGSGTWTLIAPNNEVVGVTGTDGTLNMFFTGQIAAQNGNWSWQTGTLRNLYENTNRNITGNGTYSNNQRLIDNNSQFSKDMRYLGANGVRVTESSVVGTWLSSNGDALTVNSNLTISGKAYTPTIGTCTLSGSIKLATPNSNKNLYSVYLTPAPSSACLAPNNLFSGYSVVYYTTNSQNAPITQLLILVRVPGTNPLRTIYLTPTKQ